MWAGRAASPGFTGRRGLNPDFHLSPEQFILADTDTPRDLNMAVVIHLKLAPHSEPAEYHELIMELYIIHRPTHLTYE